MCVSVTQHLTSQMSNCAVKKCTYSVAYDRQNIVGIFSEMTAFKSSVGVQSHLAC